MELSMGSKLVSNLPLSEYLTQATCYFKTIEIPTDPRFLSLHFSLTAAQKKVIRIYREQYHFKLTMHAPFMSSDLGSINPEQRQLAINSILNTMHTASEMEIQLLTCHPFLVENPAVDYRENCRHEEESLAYLLGQAKQLGVIILMENMPRVAEFHPITCDGTRFQELLWLFPEKEFGLTIDIGHALQAGINIDSLLKMDRICNFHLHDNDRQTDGHLPIQKNLTWWRKLVKSIQKSHPEASIILELKLLEEQIKSYQNLHPTPRKLKTPVL